jgi:hypothetical protein
MSRFLSWGWTRFFLLFLCGANMCFLWSHMHRSSYAIRPSPDHATAKPLTDLYPPWLAARELLIHGRDPYGSYVTREIQIAYFGSELEETHAASLSDAQRFSLAYRFAYPLYAVFLVAPTIRMDFDEAQTVFVLFFSFTLCAGGSLWLGFVRPSIIAPEIAAVFAIFLSSIPVLQGLSLLQPGLLVAALLAGTAYCACRGYLFLAGALLAVATIRPQMALLAIAWFALWLSAAWSQRQSLFWGFVSTLAALLFAAELLAPGWLLRYPHVLNLYASYTGAGSLLTLLMPVPVHRLLTVGALFIVAPFCWRTRHQPANSAPFALATSFVLTLTVTIIPTVVASFNQILLLPAILLVIHHWGELRRTRPLHIISTAFSAISFLPWLLGIALTVEVVLHITRPWISWMMLLNSSLALPLVVFGWLVLLRHNTEGTPNIIEDVDLGLDAK